MVDLSCTYLGLDIKNPLVVGSSGLTSSIDNLKNAARFGAGAVVLKSVFEEQIRFESQQLIDSGDDHVKAWKNAFDGIVSSQEHYYGEAFSYLDNYAREHTLKQYLSFVSEAKDAIDIPVIASINCTTQYDWQYFARRIQEAGADALELNVYLLPSDFQKSGAHNEQVYFDIIREVKKHVTIPLSLKTGYYFSGMAKTFADLSETGIAGLTLFNRPYNPDIDIEKFEMTATNMFSTETEYINTLRWVAILSGNVKCDIAASTGIHNYRAIIKQLLAGAAVVQMTSVFYKYNFNILPDLITELSSWMSRHDFSRISDFKGRLAMKNVSNPAAYERVQFIKLFSGIE